MMLISVRQLTPTVALIDAQNDKEVFVVTDDNVLALTEDEIGNLFQDNSPPLKKNWVLNDFRLICRFCK